MTGDVGCNVEGGKKFRLEAEIFKTFMTNRVPFEYDPEYARNVRSLPANE